MKQELSRRPALRQIMNGGRAPLPFSNHEYQRRLSKLRSLMIETDVEATLLTSMHNVAYFSGFLYCAFGRPYACVITPDRCVTISANIDYGQPQRRSVGENLVYTDWHKNNFWRAVKEVCDDVSRIGIEADHMTLSSSEAMSSFLEKSETVDLHKQIMRMRMIKSDEEVTLIRSGAKIADVGGEAIRDMLRPGLREIDVAMTGRDAMELEIAERFPDSEIRDSWVWFQSGLNTDGAHNPVTTRKICDGDIMSLNTFPMVSGYYTALERTMFLGHADDASLKIWQANVEAHELGISLIKPGAKCSEICAAINAHLESLGVLQYRTFGYGHSFGVLSHYYGREAGLELREDVHTVLEPGMVISMEPMLTVPDGTPGAGGYREHDILVVNSEGADNITGFPYGPEHNIIPVR